MGSVHHAIIDGYRLEAKPALMRAMATTAYRPLVLLPFPSAEARKEFLQARPEFPFVQGSQPAMPWKTTYKLKDGAPGGEWLFPEPYRGAILATTVETLPADLFDEDVPLRQFGHWWQSDL